MVVVVPGILGSRLADADGHEVWGLSGKALLRGIRTFGKSVKGLTLGPGLGDDHPGDGVRPVGLMRDLHALPGVWMPVDGYSGLLNWLERNFTLQRRLPGDRADAPANLIDFAYDWRLSCRYNAARLAAQAPLVRVWRTLAQVPLSSFSAAGVKATAAHAPRLAAMRNASCNDSASRTPAKRNSRAPAPASASSTRASLSTYSAESSRSASTSSASRDIRLPWSSVLR